MDCELRSLSNNSSDAKMPIIHHEAMDYLVSACSFRDFNGAQKDILKNEFMDYSSNYIIATNTGTGKTALAQLRIVEALKRGKKVIYISPYKAIAEEKREDFGFYNRYGWSCISSVNPNETKDTNDYSKYDIISMTYEKFDSVLNNARYIDGWLKKTGLLIVDEAHMISDAERGPTLESSITKILSFFKDKIRIVMLSAVLPNVENVAKWINAKFGTSEWRPVELEIGFTVYQGSKTKSKTEDRINQDIPIEQLKGFNLKPKEIFIKYGKLSKLNKIISSFTQDLQIPNQEKIKDQNLSRSVVERDRQLKKNRELSLVYDALTFEERKENIEDPLWYLSSQIIKEGGQVLIFTTDRASTESIALRLSNFLQAEKYISKSQTDALEVDFISKMNIKDDNLTRTMKHGVAFHNAGLDLQKRKLIESAYKSGLLKILVSTTTLIAGVNLPATLVIFDSLSFWNGNSQEMMTKRDFLNGCGRAGRPGYETRGRALFMSATPSSALKFISKPIEKVESQFKLDTLVFQTLALIKRNTDLGHRYTTLKEINNFFEHSFYFSSGYKIDIQSYIKQLITMGMVFPLSGNDNNLSSFIINTPNPPKELSNQYSEFENDNFLKIRSNNLASSDTQYCITKLGYETVRFYLYPRTGFLIRNLILALQSHLSNTKFISTNPFLRITIPRKISSFSIIHTLIHAKEFQSLLKTTRWKEDEIEFFRNHIDEIMVNKTMYQTEKLSEDERKCLCTSMAFFDKLNMEDIEYKTSFEYMYSRFGKGDFVALQENMEWLIGATLKITKVILNDTESIQKIYGMLLTLLKRITFGMVKDDLIELCSVKEIGRIRALLLSKHGIRTIKQIVNPYHFNILVNVLDSKNLAERIVNNAKQNTTTSKTNNHYY